jgi:hypothetical protein
MNTLTKNITKQSPLTLNSICGCIAYNQHIASYPYTHPIRPDNIGTLDIEQHEGICSIAQVLIRNS